MTRAFLGLIALLVIAPARAEIVEKPFAPEIGSRWLIDDVNDSETVDPKGKRQTQRLAQKGVLTFDEKTPDGYRVTYVASEIAATGDAPSIPIVQSAFGALKGIVFKGVTDARGRPTAIENLEEVRAQMREVADRTAEGFARTPKVAETVRSLMNALIVLDGAPAAENYLEPLLLMSAAQETGLKPGEERREEHSKPNPLGGDPIKSVTVTRIAKPDPDGVVIVTRTEALDPESLKSAILLLGRRFIRDMGGEAQGITAPKLEDLVSRLDLSIDGLSVYDVDGGMAREITTSADTRMSAMGQSMAKSERRRVAITPAP